MILCRSLRIFTRVLMFFISRVNTTCKLRERKIRSSWSDMGDVVAASGIHKNYLTTTYSSVLLIFSGINCMSIIVTLHPWTYWIFDTSHNCIERKLLINFLIMGTLLFTIAVIKLKIWNLLRHFPKVLKTTGTYWFTKWRHLHKHEIAISSRIIYKKQFAIWSSNYNNHAARIGANRLNLD